MEKKHREANTNGEIRDLISKLIIIRSFEVMQQIRKRTNSEQP